MAQYAQYSICWTEQGNKIKQILHWKKHFIQMKMRTEDFLNIWDIWYSKENIVKLDNIVKSNHSLPVIASNTKS